MPARAFIYMKDVRKPLFVKQLAAVMITGVASFCQKHQM
jgi:hypothetical protein